MVRLNLWQPIDSIGCHFVGKSFVGGWSIGEVLRTGAELKKKGFVVTYNLLTEELNDKRKVALTLQTIRKLIDSMDKSNRGNVAVKPTQLGIKISSELFFEYAEHILTHARMQGIEVEFDAEQWNVICASFAALSVMASKFHLRNFMRICVPAHLSNIRAQLSRYNLWDVNLRIVKGSSVYPESSDVSMLRDSEEIKDHYFYIARRALLAGRVPFFATMRDRTITDMVKMTKIPYGLGPFKPTIEMLYGPLGKELGEELLSDGYPVRIYVPFVTYWCKNEWKGYGMRRAATIRRLFFEDKEVRRVILREARNRFIGAIKSREKRGGGVR